MHVNSDQKRLLLLPFFHYYRLPFYRLKVDNEKLYNRLFFTRDQREVDMFRARFIRLK